MISLDIELKLLAISDKGQVNLQDRYWLFAVFILFLPSSGNDYKHRINISHALHPEQSIFLIVETKLNVKYPALIIFLL